jgi:hypothetical protein
MAARERTNNTEMSSVNRRGGGRGGGEGSSGGRPGGVEQAPISGTL